MNILITGGAGFIGSHLAERCLREQWRVSVLDDLSTGVMANIAPLSENGNFDFRNGSVLRLIIESPVRTIETNVWSLELCVLQAA